MTYGLYDSNSNIRVTPVSGSALTGLHAADGSINIILDDGANKGIIHPCGAMRVNSSAGTTYYDPSGAVYLNQLLGGHNSVFPTTVNGVKPVFYAEVLNNKYYFNNVTYTGTTGTENVPFSAWLAAASGLFLRGSAKYSVNASKVLVARTNDFPCFNYDFNTGAYLGLSIEGARTNDVLWNRDLTNAAWVASGVTVAKDQIGVDGVASSACSLTATAPNGTVTQAITAASNTRIQSIYIRRLVGSGNVSMSMDGGATFTLVDIVSLWERASIPVQTVTNPSVVIQLATSGDKIAIDLVQNEVGTFVSSPILTTTASATRAEDLLRMGSPGVAATTAATWLVGIAPVDPLVPTASTTLYNTTDATGQNRFVQLVRNQSGSNNINLAQFVGNSQTTNLNDNSNYVFASPAKFAISTTVSLTALSVNGQTAISINPGSEPAVGNLTATDVGRYSPDGSAHAYDHYQYLGYWNVAAVPATLQTMSVVNGFNPDRSRSLVSQGDSLANASGVSVPANSWLVIAGGTRPTFNNGVNGATSTQIKNIVLADSNYNNWLNIYWVGHNNITPNATVISDINAMIAHQTTTGGKFLVISPLQNSGNGTGSSTYLNTITLRSTMASTYGANYLDIASVLLANGNGSGTDNTAISNGYTPPSLQSDNIHLNDAGYAVVGAAVRAALAAKGW